MDGAATIGSECAFGAGDAEQPEPMPELGIDYSEMPDDEYSSDEEQSEAEEEDPSDAEEEPSDDDEEPDEEQSEAEEEDPSDSERFDALPDAFEEGTFVYSKERKAVAFRANLQQTQQNVVKGTARTALGKARALDKSIEKILQAREDDPGACIQLYAEAMQNDTIASNPAVANSLLVAVITAHERRCAQARSAVDAKELESKRLKELTQVEKDIAKFYEAIQQAIDSNKKPSTRTAKALEKRLARREKLQELLGFTTQQRESTPQPTRAKRAFVDDDKSADEAGPAQPPKRTHVEA